MHSIGPAIMGGCIVDFAVVESNPAEPVDYEGSGDKPQFRSPFTNELISGKKIMKKPAAMTKR